MCVSASVSFGMGALLVAGGCFAAYKASATDRNYIPLALFPVLIGIQQSFEGLVWIGAETGSQGFLRHMSLIYLLFAWVFWPAFVPYMTARLEDKKERREIFLLVSKLGFLLGLLLYLPNFWHAEWLYTEIVNHSIAYQCTLITDSTMPREIPILLYLSFIGLPPLFSSHKFLNFFGAGLIASVPLTFFAFSYAHISVLCFFAALMTLYILYIIMSGQFKKQAPARPVNPGT